MKTYVPKKDDIQREWWIVDAEGKTLGRLATEVAARLRGKHKPSFTPHLDTGDHVVIVNADKIEMTGRKLEQKMYRRHSGYPGGQRYPSRRARNMAGRHRGRKGEKPGGALHNAGSHGECTLRGKP